MTEWRQESSETGNHQMPVSRVEQDVVDTVFVPSATPQSILSPC